MEHMEESYGQASGVLPEALRQAAMELSGEDRTRVEEFRLRLGRPMAVVTAQGEREVPGEAVTEGDLRSVLEQASRFSAHTVLDQVRAGFVTIRGGHRIGLCGEAAVQNGKICSLRRLSSLAIRVAKPACGPAQEVLDAVGGRDRLYSTLVVAPPGAGKTTLLRELVRRISDGEGAKPLRVGLADERGEVAAVWEGRAQLDVGARTDVMTGCPKAAGLAILLRGMNPEVLAADEITAPEDIEAVSAAAGCGVTLLATAHGRSREDLHRRPLYRDLMALGVFRYAVFLENRRGVRCVRVEELL